MAEPKETKKKPLTLLVVECSTHLNWYKTFEGATILGHPVIVQQAEWQDISIVSYNTGKPVVSMRRASKPLPSTSQQQDRTVEVDMVLLRSVSHGIHPLDSRNLLYALIHAGVPAVNSLHSAFMFTQRPLMWGGLKSIQKKLGKDKFPLVNQTYYPSHKEMLISPEFPIVCKVGHCHSGYGKMRLTNQGDFRDFASVCAINGDYVTAEPFIDWDWDGRIQKIGPHYRVFRRRSPNWKGNVGNMAVIEDMELSDEFKLWADECAALFGGVDILGLDILHSKKDGKIYILELNDTAIGLVHKYAEEDMMFMRDLVIARMEEYFKPKDDKEPVSGATTKDLEDKIRQLEIALEREKKAKDDLAAQLVAAQNEEQPGFFQRILSTKKPTS